MKESLLQKLGFKNNEIKIYLMLLCSGPTPITTISKKTGVHRPNAYDAIEKLMQRGLVSYTLEKKRKYYRAADPTRLTLTLDDEKREVREKEKLLSFVLPELLAIKNTSAKQQVFIHEGPEGIKSIFEEILNTGKTNHCIGAWGLPYMLQYYLGQWHMRRIKKKLVDMMLFKRDAPRARELAKLPYTQCRFLPKLYESPTAINIFGDKVAFILGTSYPLGIVIESKKIAQDFLDYFNLLWSIAGKY